MIRARPCTPFLVAVLACACTSAPVHYYTLTPPAPLSADAVSAACCTVKVARVLVPPGIDRPELVMRSGDDQAVVLSNALWLAPLRDEIRSALSSDLTVKLSKAPTTKDGHIVTNVFVDVTRFESVPGQYVLVSAAWHVQGTAQPAPPVRSCATTARIAVENGVPASVHGYQQALGQIADQISAQIIAAMNEMGQNRAPGCTAD